VAGVLFHGRVTAMCMRLLLYDILALGALLSTVKHAHTDKLPLIALLAYIHNPVA